MRIGVDVGGTRIDAIAINDSGHALVRWRVHSPSNDYRAPVDAVRLLVDSIEHEVGQRCSVGVGTPEAVSRTIGLIKNASSTQVSGRPFGPDLANAICCDVRLENDANCFALLEATDVRAPTTRWCPA